MLEEGVDGRSVCGVAAHPASYQPVRAKRAGNATLRRAALELIGAGIGCDAQNDGEPGDPVFAELLALHRADRATQIRFAEEVWGVLHW